MIEINLLPEEMRNKKGLKDFLNLGLETDKIKLIGGGAVAIILILLIIIPTAGSFIREKQVSALAIKQQGLSAQAAEIKEVDKEINILKSKTGSLNGLTKRKFLWARKLNELSDLILPGIWLTGIKAKTSDVLTIEGNVISNKEEAMASVGKFMKNIKENTSFFGDFDNIRLESVQRKTMETRDIFEFRIALYFKNDK